MDEMKKINREELIRKLIVALPKMRKRLKLSYDNLENATGIGTKRIQAFIKGTQLPK